MGLVQKELLEVYFRDTLGLADWRTRVDNRMENGQSWLYRRLISFVSIENASILDVGCGFGDLIREMETDGSYKLLAGIDPDFDWALEARRHSSEKTVGIYIAKGERLPFGDSIFDGVICNQVIEHVEDVAEVIFEMMRVCSPGGWLYISAPNYIIPYEYHYHMPIIPWLPKRVSGWLIKILGRNPNYLLCCIHFINPFSIRRILRNAGAVNEINVIRECFKNPILFTSEGVREWANKLKSIPLPSWLVFLFMPSFDIIVWKNNK